MKRTALLAALGTLAAGAVVSIGLAAGGASIAAAPVVVPGQQNFGNTANMPNQNGYRREYWRLRLVSGDALTVNFGIAAANVRLRVELYAPDVTDFNVERSGDLEDERPQSNGKGQLTYTAQSSGLYPIRFWSFSSEAGPFDFAAYVRHAVRLFIPPRSSVTRTASVAVQVRNPDGAPISDTKLRITLRGIWGGQAHTLGKTSATNGLATFKLKLPASLKGETIRLRAIAAGPEYIGTVSTARAVRVR